MEALPKVWFCMILNINTYPRCIIAAIILGGFIMFAILATDASRHNWEVCIDMDEYHEGKFEYLMIVLGIFTAGYVIGKFSKMIEGEKK